MKGFLTLLEHRHLVGMKTCFFREFETISENDHSLQLELAHHVYQRSISMRQKIEKPLKEKLERNLRTLQHLSKTIYLAEFIYPDQRESSKKQLIALENEFKQIMPYEFDIIKISKSKCSNYSFFY